MIAIIQGLTRLTRATNPGILSFAYAVGLTYTFDLLYTNRYLSSSSAALFLGSPDSGRSVRLISTIESVCTGVTIRKLDTNPSKIAHRNG